MRNLLLYIMLLLPCLMQGQIITTFAGNGTAANTGDNGPATAASINYPIGGAFDKFGNFYFATGTIGNSIRKIDRDGIITTVAGTGTAGYNGDNIAATTAELKNPQAVAVDSFGNVYIAEEWANRVRKIDVTTGLISTVAGNGVGSYNGDNIPATDAEIFGPVSLCIDKLSNLYIGEFGGSRVRKISTSGMISTYAGNGICGFGANNVPATTAQICVWGICFDNENNLYIADDVRRVYKVNVAGIITFYAGNGTDGFSGDGGPATAAETEPYMITIDKYGNLFIAEYEQSRIRMISSNGIISTIVGNGIANYSGDNGPASAAEINFPAGVALDSCDNLYISDSRTFRFRKVTYSKCDYLAVPDVGLPNELSIYPNPATNQLQIDNVATPANYKLQNLIGSTQQEGTLKQGNNTLSLSTLPTGMYLLEMIDEEGNKTVKKIIKQ
jgi:hypothetical protein